jgi:uncharacterized protein (TIGR02147 family)
MEDCSIFKYLDYREYLKDHYEASKRRSSFFSYRYISVKTGLDASFYVKVLQKQMHLSLKSLPGIVSFLGLNKKECEYFTLLVRFNRAKQQDETRLYFEKLIELRELSNNTSTLIADKYEYFSKWYYVALRELLNYYSFKGDFKSLGEQLNPPISEAKAKKAIELLERLDLVKKNEKGEFELTEKFITTGESWNSLAIENFQKEMIRMAETSIDRLPKKDRETSTVTISMSRSSFNAMKDRLREFRKELLEMARMEQEPDGVFQMNFQIFPLTGDIEQEVKP